jgi:hypothetical protein
VGSLRRLAPFLTALAVLVAAPAASAGVITLGSDLKGDANVIEHHGADSAFWNVALESGMPTSAPVGGQVTEVRIKGTVVREPSGRIKPRPMIHFQTLHPMGDGTVRVDLSSAAFYVPHGGDPNQISTYRPINMCLRKGDYLDFNDIGGNEWHWGPYDGMPFKTFSAVRGSAVSFYTKNAGTNIHSRWAPMRTTQGEELLMQMKFATGPHATDTCPGGYAQHKFSGLEMRDATLQSSSRTVRVRTTCPNRTYGSCRGVLRAEAVIGGQSVTVGSATFGVTHAYSKTVEVPLTSAALKAVKSGVSIKLVAVGHDDPRNDRRVYYMRVFDRTPDDVVPVQRTTTVASTTLSANVSKKLHTRRLRR